MNATPILFNRKEECYGCSACYAICSKEAISLVEDEEGFKYPQIDKSKCIRCYMCLKVCPFKEKIFNHDEKIIDEWKKKVINLA